MATDEPRRGSGRARIVDVAALAGVAPGTVSKALNGTGQLSTGTRERVQRAAAQLGFVPDPAGRALRSGRSFTVGLVTTDSFGRFTIPVMLGVEDVLGAGDFAVVLADTRDDPLRERHQLRALVARGVDGIIVTGRRTDPRPPVGAPVPVVYAFTPSARESDTSVLVDEARGVFDVVDHLVRLGRRRIAHVSGHADHASALTRAAALVQRVAERAPSGARVVGEPLFGSWSEQWGRSAVDLLLAAAADDLPDAITCGSDQIARGVCDRLRELGRRVPEDVAVTGFDDWDVMALASRPPLTTVDLRLEALGRRAAELLLAAVDDAPAPGVHRMPARLVVRASTAGG